MRSHLAVMGALLLLGCAQADQQPAWGDSDPTAGPISAASLPSWNEGAAKNAIMEVVARVTDPTGPDFVPEPERNRPYTELVYQPMLEVLDYLRAHGFKTFITSGGGIEFMRPWVEEVYGIPPEQVIGSSIKVEFHERDGEPVLVRLPEIDFIDDKEGKPVGIHKFIGRRPIAAFGNSDGDFQMLQWATTGEGLRLGVLIHHTDAEREWAYDRDSNVGRLDRGLDEANGRGWVVVDMKNDWKQVYSAPPQ